MDGQKWFVRFCDWHFDATSSVQSVWMLNSSRIAAIASKMFPRDRRWRRLVGQSKFVAAISVVSESAQRETLVFRSSWLGVGKSPRCQCRKFISPHLDAWTSGYLLVQEIHPEPRGMPSRWSSNHLGRRGLDIRMPAGVGLAANTKPRFDIWLSVASPRLRRAAPFASRRPRDWIPRPSRWNSNHLG